jgi:hypothetical protein
MPLIVSAGVLGIFAGSNTWYRKKTHSAMAPTAKIRMGLAIAMMMIEISGALFSRGKVTRHLPLQYLVAPLIESFIRDLRPCVEA